MLVFLGASHRRHIMRRAEDQRGLWSKGKAREFLGIDGKMGNASDT